MSIKIASHDPVEGIEPIDYSGVKLWMVESHKGLVLGTWERNGYDDSDFYATVWNPEKGKPEDIEYASTRGWSYANGASVDATPEVIEAYRAWKAERAAEYSASTERLKSAIAEVGSEVVLSGLRKRADLNGKTGVVFWKGIDRFSRSYYGAPPKHRLGVNVAGDKVFVSASSATVVGAKDNSEESERSLGVVRTVAAYSGRPAVGFL